LAADGSRFKNIHTTALARRAGRAFSPGAITRSPTSTESSSGKPICPVTIPLDIGITEGLSWGRDDGSTVTTDYDARFDFTGRLEKVVDDVSGEPNEDKGAQMCTVMAHKAGLAAATSDARHSCYQESRSFPCSMAEPDLGS